MARIKRFFECALPSSVCNLECSYCYVIQENKRAMKNEQLDYSPQYIARALSQERLGGVCWINLCASGETMAQKEIVPLVKALLLEGHFVSLTTNGTLSNKYDELITECSELLGHLHLAFSLHYVELNKRGWIERYFDNVSKMRDAGASVLVQFNLCDEYIPYLEEIKSLCLEKVGAYPQVALTRNEQTKPISIMTSLSAEEYYKIGQSFQSPLFDFTYKNFMVKRTEYCYAGEWSGVLNMKTGLLKKCYCGNEIINIFKDPDEPIPFSAVGYNCSSSYCINSSHFLSLGVIPDIKTPSYAQLRNRKEAAWYTEEMESFLHTRLYDNNEQHNLITRIQNTGFRTWVYRHPIYLSLHKIKEKL